VTTRPCRPSLGAVLLCALLLALPLPARAALLIEGLLDGTPVRIVSDAGRMRVLVGIGEHRHLVDLARGAVHAIGADGAGPAIALPAPRQGPGGRARLDRWSHGPRIAGHGSAYHVLRIDGRICAEVLVGRWSLEAVRPAVQALDLVERLNGGPTRLSGDMCEAIPFRAFAARGWPLLAGLVDRAAFETRSIRFDYLPRRDERALLDGGRG
jgi:hypothetical protein